MKALIMMLFNLKNETYHPILYFEKPFLSGDTPGFTRYKSKGHRTEGFKNRKDALKIIQTELIDKLTNYEIIQDLDGDLPWDGWVTPADTQLR